MDCITANFITNPKRELPVTIHEALEAFKHIQNCKCDLCGRRKVEFLKAPFIRTLVDRAEEYQRKIENEYLRRIFTPYR